MVSFNIFFYISIKFCLEPLNNVNDLLLPASIITEVQAIGKFSRERLVTTQSKVQVIRKFGGERFVISCKYPNCRRYAKSLRPPLSLLYFRFLRFLQNRYLGENEHVWTQRNLYLDFPYFFSIRKSRYLAIIIFLYGNRGSNNKVWFTTVPLVPRLVPSYLDFRRPFLKVDFSWKSQHLF